VIVKLSLIRNWEQSTLRLNISCEHFDPASDGSFVFYHNFILVLENITKIRNKLLSFNRSDVELIIINELANELRIPGAVSSSIDCVSSEVNVNIREPLRAHIELFS